VDGWRIMAYRDGDRVRLLSRHGVDHTKRFADIAGAVAKLSARTLVCPTARQAPSRPHGKLGQLAERSDSGRGSPRPSPV
jgi:bifunctional non-homologous end joining protein LigD